MPPRRQNYTDANHLALQVMMVANARNSLFYRDFELDSQDCYLSFINVLLAIFQKHAVILPNMPWFSFVANDWSCDCWVDYQSDAINRTAMMMMMMMFRTVSRYVNYELHDTNLPGYFNQTIVGPICLLVRYFAVRWYDTIRYDRRD